MRVFAVTSAIFLLAACNGTTEPPPQAQKPDMTRSSSAPFGQIEPIEDSRSDQNAVQLGGVVLPLNFDHKVVYDRTSESKTGAMQRQVFVQALAATPTEVETHVRRSFADLGFELVKEAPSSGGKRFDFRDTTGQDVLVLIRPRLNGKDGDATPIGIAQFTFHD